MGWAVLAGGGVGSHGWGLEVSGLADFLDDRCARFVRDPHYRMALIRERFRDEAVEAARHRSTANYRAYQAQKHNQTPAQSGVFSLKEAS